MVCMRTGDFTQDVPEPSNAHVGAATNELRNAARETPLPPPLLMSLEQLLATQNELMRVLTENLVQHEACLPHHQQGVETSYTNFLMTHASMFAKATGPLEGDNWLHIIESKFGLLHCTALRSRRLYSRPRNFVDPRVLGGLTSLPLFRTATRCHGPSSAQLSVGTTSLWA
jgi:hypothetical protein